jgi:NSS family neurotransmitter:Na+ symporter
MQGELFGTVFFLLVALAALGSAVALMEPVVGAIMQHWRMRRVTSVLLVGTLVWLVSITVTMSFSSGAELMWFGYRNLFAFLDAITADLLLPLVSLLTALLVGWHLRPEILRVELYRESDLFFSLWRFLLRYIAPPAICLIILVAMLGVEA